MNLNSFFAFVSNQMSCHCDVECGLGFLGMVWKGKEIFIISFEKKS
jgi:hypothetical protein